MPRGLSTLQLKDLKHFILILLVFIISFGAAFQAILDPNKPPSWGLLVDILWRPYWQMFGELFIDDATTGMGRLLGFTISSSV